MARRERRGLLRDLDRVDSILNKQTMEEQIKAIREDQHKMWQKRFEENPLKMLFPTLKKNDDKTD